ncbi:hypothetical protein BJX99DRAFT_255190 [Aspergillus californicus]
MPVPLVGDIKMQQCTATSAWRLLPTPVSWNAPNEAMYSAELVPQRFDCIVCAPME